jgi:pimeloyl-ACP methyl ester carboxylesterase
MMPSSFSEQSVSVAGIDLHYYCGGDGPPLLTLHGGGGNPGWLMVHEALAAHYTVYAPSHPGFGMTSRPEWIARPSDMAVFYLWMLQEMGLDSVHLLGHSFGGWLAADMATTCPQVVNRLVLVDAVGVKPKHSDILDVFILTPEEIRANAFYNPPEHIPEWERLYGREPTPEAADRAEDALEMLIRLCWKPYMHDLRLPALLPRVKSPTLVVWGRQDAIVPLECGEIYQQGIPGSKLHVIEACGHSPHIEKPNAFADAVLPFLSQA